MSETKNIVSCQIAFAPVESKNFIKDINEVLGIIQKSKLHYETGTMSTVVRGELSEIIGLMENIYKNMNDVCGFTMDVKLSNICGK